MSAGVGFQMHWYEDPPFEPPPPQFSHVAVAVAHEYERIVCVLQHLDSNSCDVSRSIVDHFNSVAGFECLDSGFDSARQRRFPNGWVASD